VNHGPIINFPTEAEEREQVRKALGRMRTLQIEAQHNIDDARPALRELCEAMRAMSGQSLKLRALLFSLWNGKGVSLNEITGLDMELRYALAKVILAWGLGRGADEFFYDAMKQCVKDQGIWTWFLERSDEVDL
jgi:hypothetical protein